MSFIIGILLGALVVIFALQNTMSVMVQFLGWGFEGSVALIVLLSMAVGVVISLLFSMPSFIKGMMAESKLHRRNQELHKELEDHKVMLAQATKPLAPGDVVVHTVEETTTVH